jgi:hypothetical protein
MDENVKLLTIAIPTVTVIVGIVINIQHVQRLDRRITCQLASLCDEMAGLMGQVEETTKLR